jgi:phosphopantothenate-cysteine ligase/phosphopantothenoylcysteine decarboxylase/phosphopantothenate--cysteine ligase
MHVLITAGNTLAPLDAVRGLTNIFTGRTGATIAQAGQERGHTVTLFTSHPDTVTNPAVSVVSYRTFAALADLLAAALPGQFDAVIHSAAVSDYLPTGVFAPTGDTQFVGERFVGSGQMRDCAAGKVKSDEPELWLRLTRAPKLIDRMRTDWRFAGVLVKFKLEVGISEAELQAIAERSRVQSAADVMVANTLAEAKTWALVGPITGAYQRVARADLPARLWAQVEALHAERNRG